MSANSEKIVLIKYKSKYDRVRMSNFSKNIGESLKLNVWRFKNGSDLSPIKDLIVDSIGVPFNQLKELYKIFVNHAADIAPYFSPEELEKLNEINFFIQKTQEIEPKSKELIITKAKYQELLKENEELKKWLRSFD